MIKNLFDGKNAILDYINPDKNPPTPLIELPIQLNPYKDKGVRIFAKLMNTLPLMNVKSLPSYNMLIEARDRGELDGVSTIIENSSGNTVFSLSIIGNLLGIKSTKAVVSNEISLGKLKMLRFFGTEIIVNKESICPDPSDKTSGIYKAKVWAKENKWFNAGQYDNINNPLSHEKWTGKQIWEQLDGNISIFCAGLGTTGTMVGAGGYLKSKNKNIKNIAVTRLPNNPVPGPRTYNLLREIAFPWKEIIDDIEEVGTVDSYSMSMKLCRNGLLVGPSSGFNLKGLYNYLDKVKDTLDFENLRNKKGEIICVFICCDTPFPYINEYFEYLEESNFPVIENQNLLSNNEYTIKNKKIFSDFVYEISIDQVYKEVFIDSPKVVWEKINNNLEIKTNKKVIILDIRNKDFFNHFHIPSSINISSSDLEGNINDIESQFSGKKVIIVCERGVSSKYITSILRDRKIDAYSMKGGIVDWSRLNLPRIRPEGCVKNLVPRPGIEPGLIA